MAFEAKEWKDRIAEFINRRTLTKQNGTTEIVTVSRNEGEVLQSGDAFSAANMNDLEQRIADAFGEINQDFLPLTGGTVNGPVILQGQNAPQIITRGTNIARETRVSLTSSGLSALFNYKDGNNYTYFTLNKEDASLDNLFQLYMRKNGEAVKSFNSIHTGNASNYIAGKNLFDNYDFAINQRNASGVISDVYGYDRWKGRYSIGSGYVAMANGNYIYQPMENSIKQFLNGKQITVSVLYLDGTVDSGSVAYNSAPTSVVTIFSKRVNARIYPTSNTQVGNIYFQAVQACNVVAVKLEVGSVATAFVPPNTAEELAKCQRYYVELCKGGSANIAVLFGSSTSNKKAENGQIKLPVEMRTGGVVTVSGSFIVAPSGTTGGTVTSNVNVVMNDMYNAVVALTADDYTFTAFRPYLLQPTETSSIAISADL